jgi:hypothetical protein
LRAIEGEKLEEMDKAWDMIFELEWDNELGYPRGTPKMHGHQLDGMTDKEKNNTWE